jgi:hypothetical protein
MTNISGNVSTAAAAATPTARVAVPAGLHPIGPGGLLSIPAGSLSSDTGPVNVT